MDDGRETPTILRDRGPSPVLPRRGEELGLLRFLDALEAEGAAAKELSAKGWEENIRQVRGDTWRLRRPPHFQANLIRNQVERKVAALTEAKPTVKVVSLKSGLDGARHVLNRTIRAIWDSQHLDQTLNRMSFFAMTLGAGFLYTYWDPAAAHHAGDIMVRMVDPRKVLIDPAITEAERLDEAAYLMIEQWDTLAMIRQRFPGKGLLVKADKHYAGLITRRRRGESAGVLSAVLRGFPQVFRSGPQLTEGPIGRAMLKEYWFQDPTLGADGEALFPTGRHIIRSGDVILVDEANPYWDGGWPLDMMDWNLDFDSSFGQGEVAELRRMQEAFNRVGDGMIRNTLLSNNVKIIADLDALDQDKWDQLTNEGGIVIKKRPGRELSYEMPKEMPQYLFSLLTTLPQIMDLLTGNVDVTRVRSAGIVSASAIEGLQTASQSLVRSIARRMEGLLERMGQKLISRIFQFYTSDRTLAELGPSNEWVSFVFQRQKLLEDDRGESLSKLEQAARFRDFRFLVVPGSSLASTRVQRTMMLLQLRQALMGIAPSIQTILREADMGDPEVMIQESLEEMKKLGIEPTPPQKTRKR